MGAFREDASMLGSCCGGSVIGPGGEVAAAGRWQVGQRVHAVWAGNGFHYAATLREVDHEKRGVTVDWDDGGTDYRTLSFDQVVETSEDTAAWSRSDIDRVATVKDTPDKGRCLFVNADCAPGQIIFAERPTQVVVPELAQAVFDHLRLLHDAKPLNLGSASFYFAALMSALKLDERGIDVILDKFVPSLDEEPDEDVHRIIKSLTEDVPELKLQDRPIDPRRLQRLVSAWRFNCFGHHKEDGLVLYDRISMCSHSCDPSCCWSYGADDAFVLRARVALRAGDEITISYLQDEDLLKCTATRRQKLLNWQFTCQCRRCQLRVDTGRGFRCPSCGVGALYAAEPQHLASPSASASLASSCDGSVLEPCAACGKSPSPDDAAALLRLERDYTSRVESLDKTNVADVELVFQAAVGVFERHWLLYVMDTMLVEAYRGKRPLDALEHQCRRAAFHHHYYARPTFILAWCHEETGDIVQLQYPHRYSELKRQYQFAYHMLSILCGRTHPYTSSPFNKLWRSVQSLEQNRTRESCNRTRESC
eukprot:TRINITY_DN22547_c0_g1_i2.p1 TRINITY_DN22547_c0_g1~~TRINITY_DN22547_c0_g1_i2.p1  ORF type:complete len:536 (-),score=92.03 TRINITY_DN22547_c0_g1_i2:103-1710(-)